MPDISTVTNTAQIIADMHINNSLTVFLLAAIAIVNAVSLFLVSTKKK